MVGDFTSFDSRNHVVLIVILFIHCSRIIEAHDLLFFSKIHPACHNDANRVKPGSNLKVTDKHIAEC